MTDLEGKRKSLRSLSKCSKRGFFLQRVTRTAEQAVWRFDDNDGGPRREATQWQQSGHPALCTPTAQPPGGHTSCDTDSIPEAGPLSCLLLF